MVIGRISLVWLYYWFNLQDLVNLLLRKEIHKLGSKNCSRYHHNCISKFSNPLLHPSSTHKNSSIGFCCWWILSNNSNYGYSIKRTCTSSGREGEDCNWSPSLNPFILSSVQTALSNRGSTKRILQAITSTRTRAHSSMVAYYTLTNSQFRYRPSSYKIEYNFACCASGKWGRGASVGR